MTKEKRHRQRQEAKLARNRGQAAMKKAKMNHAQWTQQFDPLFRVKGKERHRRTHEK